MTMERGAVAMFDALGFKGIWQHVDADRVLAHLKNLQEHGRAARSGLASFGEVEKNPIPFGSINVTFISDTVVVGVQMKAGVPGWPEYALDYVALDCVTQCVAKVVAEAGRHDPCLAYRGAITVGDFAIDDRFLVGPAIDEVAAAHESASCAVVWLMPPALEVVLRAPELLAATAELVPFDVPLPNDKTAGTYFVSPFPAVILGPAACSIETWTERVLRSFDRTVSARVRELQQNTERALLAAAEHQQRRPTPRRRRT